jgi:hypothetical protein
MLGGADVAGGAASTQQNVDGLIDVPVRYSQSILCLSFFKAHGCQLRHCLFTVHVVLCLEMMCCDNELLFCDCDGDAARLFRHE